MKHLFSLTIICLALFTISCENEVVDIIPSQDEIKAEKRGLGCPMYITPYRSAGVSQINGAPCACEQCPGGCSIKKYPTYAPNQYGGVVIIFDDDVPWFYFTDNLDYTEESFIIDEDYEVLANIDGECVENVLLAGEYTFESRDTYEELDGIESFGRVQVNLSE